MELVSLIISLVSGALGGNLTGAAMSQKNLGILGNTIAGLVGGAAGDYIMQAVGLLGAVTAASQGAPEAANALDLSSILASIGGGAGGGAILTALISLIKDAVSKN